MAKVYCSVRGKRPALHPEQLIVRRMVGNLFLFIFQIHGVVLELVLVFLSHMATNKVMYK